MDLTHDKQIVVEKVKISAPSCTAKIYRPPSCTAKMYRAPIMYSKDVQGLGLRFHELKV
jgi:hypothetical protein